MKNVKKKLILIVLMTFLIICIGKNVSMAFTAAQNQFFNKGYTAIGTKIDIGGLRNSNKTFDVYREGIYCIHHKEGFQQGDFEVDEYIELKGSKAFRYDRNGNTRVWDNWSKNGVLEYLLHKENYKKSLSMWNGESGLSVGDQNEVNRYPSGTEGIVTIRNAALRVALLDWMGEKDRGHGAIRDLGVNADYRYQYSTDHWAQQTKDEVNGFIQRANNYVTSNTAPDLAISVPSAFSTVTCSTDNVIGPIKIAFTEGKLNISAYGINSENITNIEYYSDSKCENKISNVNNITSNTSFYIKNKSQSIIKEIKAKVVDTNQTQINVQMWFAKPQGYFSSNFGQAVAIVKTSETNASSEETTIQVSYGSITINKKDGSTNLKDVEFKVYLGKNKFLGKNGNLWKYDATKDTATVFKTNNNGEVKIENLCFKKYYIFETKVADGYNLSLQDGYKTRYSYTDNNGNTQYVNLNYVYDKDKHVADLSGNQQDVTINFTNTKYGKITINKKDGSTNLKDVEFKVYLGKNKFLGKNGNDWIYDATKDTATVFKTDNNGNVIIEKLSLNKTYYIFETKTAKGYNLSLQDGYNTRYSYTDNNGNTQYVNLNYVYDKDKHVADLSGNQQDVTINFTNTKYGKITINKKDGSTNLKNVEFKVYLGKNKFLGKDGNNWKYDATKDTATVFKTDNNGEVIIERLSLDKTYYIFETKTAEGYNLSLQDGYKTRYSYTDNNGNTQYVNLNYVYDKDKHVADLSGNQQDVTINFTNTKYGSLTIYKKDTYSNDKLSGAEVKLYNTTYKKWLTGSEGSYSLGETASKYSITNGEKTFSNIPIGTYTIYEVTTPTGYDLIQQVGYQTSGNMSGSVKCLEDIEVETGTTVTKTIYNKKFRKSNNYKTRFIF